MNVAFSTKVSTPGILLSGQRPGSVQFVQDNHSRSQKGVLRGLHYQVEHAQGKLVRVTAGEVLDVAVDIRRSSPQLSANGPACTPICRQIPPPAVDSGPGFAHGFVVLSEYAEFLYKTTDYYTAKSAERCIRWDDPDAEY